jgi:glucosamine--fructose-6-phosphate aminotransferase (isomerizing)
MCGIIGYVGEQAAGPILLEGLQRLEYRGYDSSGIAVIDHDGALAILKRAGQGELAALGADEAGAGGLGIGHTRWATHGAVTDQNAHPHASSSGDVIVVQNGIVENYRDLRQRLLDAGVDFVSDTDTEVIPQLISLHLRDGLDFPAALRTTMDEIAGGNSVVALHTEARDRIYVARKGNAGGIVVGFGEGEMFVASDMPALIPHTNRVRYIENGETAEISVDAVRIWDAGGEAVAVEPVEVPLDPVAVAKGPYKHFMQKEIWEQPRALSDTIRGRARLNPNGVHLEDIPLSDDDLRKLRRVLIIGMGTSMNAGMIGRAFIERLGGIPADFDNSSEFRYREPLLGPETLVVSISQSGETVDTLGAMHHVKEVWGAPQITICNVVGAESTRVTDGSAIYLRCGPEIGVASTKTFTGSIAALYLLGCRIGMARGYLSEDALDHALEGLISTPSLVDQMLQQSDRYEAIAQEFRDVRNLLYLGRGLQYPIAMEGALKCKEISYVHAEGYPAGEMKHGPIALIDRHTPTVAFALQDPLYDKMWSTIQQVQARNGLVVAIGTEGDDQLAAQADHFIPVPPMDDLITPFATAIPAQLIAYYLATLRGADVDQPRNLAKTVTVE